jgi:hypothetical protein
MLLPKGEGLALALGVPDLLPFPDLELETV